MNVTQDLMAEHQLILSYIHLLQEYVERAESGSVEILLDSGAEFVDFIQTFADRFHHAKEEEILFKHMEAGGVLTHCNPLPQMLYEHEEGRAAVQAMLKALEARDAQAFAQGARAYALLLVDHIYKEDNILYLMAEDGLSDTQKSDVLKAYEVAEKRLRRDAVWAMYEARLSVLRDRLDASASPATGVGG